MLISRRPVVQCLYSSVKSAQSVVKIFIKSGTSFCYENGIKSMGITFRP